MPIIPSIQWINIEEEKPWENLHNILVVAEDCFGNDPFVGVAKYIKGKFVSACNPRELFPGEVTHWSPFPSAPVKEA